MNFPNFNGLNFVRGFERCGLELIVEVGGKNASLGELAKAGFNIPPGFVITSKAYRRFLQEFDLEGELKQLLSLKSPRSIASEAKRLISFHPLPYEIQREIDEACESLTRYLGDEEPAFAVRSSAASEDSLSASFAGQFDTFLGLKSRESILEAIKGCWASLFNERAITYRNSRDTAFFEDSPMSVGVQRMVDARSAGVIFTLDPVTGNRANIVINANWGLGESVVKGSANVDSFVINKVTLEVVKKDISVKESQHAFKEGGVEESEVPSDLKHIPCLNDEEAKELARQAKLIERHFGRPQDIEFAIDRKLDFPKNIFITQSRPETRWSSQTKPLMQPKGHIAKHLVDWFRGR